MAALEVEVTSADLRQAYLDLKAARADLMPELRRGIRAAAKPLVDAVKREAAFSARIPGAVKSKVSFGVRTAGVKIVADAKKAPHARPLNNGGSTGSFRHPVYADAARQTRREWTWVSQPANNFWARGIERADPEIDRAMADVLNAVAVKAGFK